MTEHRTYVSPIDGGPEHRSECGTCGTVLRLHDTVEDAQAWADFHRLDGTPPWGPDVPKMGLGRTLAEAAFRAFVITGLMGSGAYVIAQHITLH